MKNPRKATVRLASAVQMRNTATATPQPFPTVKPVTFPKPQNKKTVNEEMNGSKKMIVRAEEISFRNFIKRHLPHQPAPEALASRIMNAIKAKK